jgi:hypothetical protein
MNDDPKLQLLEKSIRAIKMPSKTDTKTFSYFYYNFCYWLEDNNPFARYKHVSSTEEYINMPRGERTFLWIWYHSPIISRSDSILGRKSERDSLNKYLQRNFPVQYFLRQRGFALKVKLSNAYDWVCHKLNPRQKWLKKQIPDDWSDKVWLITELNFAMVVHFVEGEKCFDNTDYENSGENHVQFSNDLKDCYDYIKNRRPALQKQHDASYPDEETTTGVYAVDYAETNRLEILIDSEDTKYLTWIVTNRGFFWT